MHSNNHTDLIWWLEKYSDITLQDQKNELVWEKSYETGKVSVIDFFNLKWLSDSDIEKLIIERLHIGEYEEHEEYHNLNTKKILKQIQSLYDEAIEIYQEELLIDLRKPFTNQKFKNIHDAIIFCKNTYTCNNKDRRQLYCDIIKIMYWLAQINNSWILDSLDDEAINYVNQNIINTWDFSFNISELFEDMKNSKKTGIHSMQGEYIIKYDSWWEKRIPIKMKFRGKKKRKMILKAFYSSKNIDHIYEIIKDSIGIELEVESKENAFYILQHYYKRLNNGLTRKLEEYKQKPGFFEENDIQKAMEDPLLDDDFKEFLKNNWEITQQKNTGSHKYKDAKFIGRELIQTEQWEETIFIEERVVLSDNKNQSGIASDKVINGKKKILSMVGLRWWVSRSYIRRVVEDTIWKWVKKQKEKIVDEYIKGMIQINVGDRVVYTTETRIERILKTVNEYPPHIIQAIRKHSPRLWEAYDIDSLIRKVKDETKNIQIEKNI